LAFLLLSIALLDLRGKPVLERGEIPDQRTIILIDSSSSMLAEDIKPNRYLKALTIARMFVKGAVGHQISVVSFSDIQKKIVPFTDDIDLLDARISGLADQDIRRGGSSLKQAIQETINYYLEESDTISGNLLVITDAEDNGDFESVSLPDGLTVAFVGVGTLSGSTIPLRSEQGSFDNYKMYQGEKVITRLDESLLKNLTSKIKNSKYWIATSYSMPIDEILTFFKRSFSKKIKDDVKAKPAKFEVLIIPGFALLFLSLLMSAFGKTFRPVIVILIMINIAYAVDKAPKEELDEDSKKILNKVKSGEIKREALLDVAEVMLRAQKFKEANEIYKEQEKMTNKDYDLLFNYGTSQMQSGEIKDALSHLEKIEKNDVKLANEYKKNLLTSLLIQKKKDEEKKNEEKNKKNDDQQNKKNKDDQKSDGNQEKKDKNNDKGDKQEDKNSDSGDNDKDKQDKEKEKKEKEEREKKKKEKEDKNNEESKPKNLDDKENKIKQDRKMVKVPALLQQLMSDDRNLQKKYIDTDTFKKNKDDKDW